MRFITVFDGVITGNHDGRYPANLKGTVYQGHNQIRVPECSNVCTGDKCVCYNEKTWMKRPLKDLANEGLFTVPHGKIIDGDELRDMTDTEKYAHGIGIPAQHKFEDGKLIPKTPEEMVADGEITALEAAEKKLESLIRELNTIEAKARLEVDEGYAEERKNRLRALLAVREQAGWPDAVIWP